LLAHDLRNPLSALHSNVGFLESVIETADDDVLEALRDARVSCDGLMYIIDNMDLIGRSLMAPANLPTARMGLMPVLHEVVSRHRALAKSHGVTLELEEAHPSIRVIAHRDMLVRATGNLVRNGIQHGLPGGTVRIRVRLDADDACLICVEDSGVPLSPELADRAFDPEAQTDLKSATGGRYSRGLGLYAARLAAEAIGAEVRAGSGNAGGGSSLELRIPSG
jgi:signal transduction histidine kinase